HISWTTLRNRTSSQFNDGLDAFLERCKDHLDEYNSCWCLCRKFNNNTKCTIKEIDQDIVKCGFSAFYTTRDHHGEPPVVNLTPETYNDMVDFLHDVGMENTDGPTEGSSFTNETGEGSSATNEPPEGLNNSKHTGIWYFGIGGLKGFELENLSRRIRVEMISLQALLGSHHIEDAKDGAGVKTDVAQAVIQQEIGTDGNPDEYPSLVSDFGLNHTSKATGTYVNEAIATKHMSGRNREPPLPMKGEVHGGMPPIHEPPFGRNLGPMPHLALHGVKGMRSELMQVHTDVKELTATHQKLTAQELQHVRAAIEHEKKVHVENYEHGQVMEKNLLTMARELEKLRAEMANAEKRDRATAATANLNPSYNPNYGKPEVNYAGNPYPKANYAWCGSLSSVCAWTYILRIV
nr:protein FLX-like 1 [Tanacetum cinerariifolium]